MSELYRIVNLTKDTVLAKRAEEAKTFFSRFAGLMFRKSLSKERALIFYRTKSIHTCFMRFTLDVIFVDRYMKVLRIIRGLRPWRIVFCGKAHAVIESSFNNGNLKNTETGDKLQIRQLT